MTENYQHLSAAVTSWLGDTRAERVVAALQQGFISKQDYPMLVPCIDFYLREHPEQGDAIIAELNALSAEMKQCRQ